MLGIGLIIWNGCISPAFIELPYYPNVPMGWDSSPRIKQSINFSQLGSPFLGLLSENTPENFKKALLDVHNFMDRHPE